MIEVHLKGGKTVIVDADKADYELAVNSNSKRNSLVLIRGQATVGEYDLQEVAGWNESQVSQEHRGIV